MKAINTPTNSCASSQSSPSPLLRNETVAPPRILLFLPISL